NLRLPLEARHALGVPRKWLGENLEGHFAAELRVAGAIDLAHATRANGSPDLVRSELRSWWEDQRVCSSCRRLPIIGPRANRGGSLSPAPCRGRSERRWHDASVGRTRPAYHRPANEPRRAPAAEERQPYRGRIVALRARIDVEISLPDQQRQRLARLA